MKVILPAVFLVVALCGCGSPRAPRAEPTPAKLYYGTVNIFTDPPGAHVYSGGEYWGETSPDKPVVRIWWNSTRTGGTHLTVKKRGYKATPYHMVLRLEHDTREASERNPQKVVIVLDTE